MPKPEGMTKHEALPHHHSGLWHSFVLRPSSFELCHLRPSIQVMALEASLSKAATHISRCSSFVSSILLWLIPCRLCTNIMTVGMPERATSAASCNGPEGRRCGF